MSAKHTPGEVWRDAAEALGWEYSPAIDAWTHARFDDEPATAEDACFIEGIETEDQARAAIARATGEAGQ